MLVCDFNGVVGAKIIKETINRVKVIYFAPRKGEIIKWLDKGDVSKIYRPKR
tara:strand:- start:982 stop:1137 length:156 start_codon:yes stop_codon:yes gene_type:complete